MLYAARRRWPLVSGRLGQGNASCGPSKAPDARL